MMKPQNPSLTGLKDYGLTGYLLGIVFAGAWLTHVISSFINETWLVLVAGAVFMPVAVLHGFYLWFT
jgi:hypothetical protein